MDNLFFVVILTVVITVALFQIVSVIRANRTTQTYPDTTIDNLNKVRPIIDSLILEIMNLGLSTQSFETLMSYSMKYFKLRVNEADYLSSDEKTILNDGVIQTLIEPYLRVLYNKRFNDLT